MRRLHTTTENEAPHHVVIVGGGFGGLYAAESLAHAPVKITLIDRTNHHLFQPLLYQVATGHPARGRNRPADPRRPVAAGQRPVLLDEVDRRGPCARERSRSARDASR